MTEKIPPLLSAPGIQCASTPTYERRGRGREEALQRGCEGVGIGCSYLLRIFTSKN